MFVETNPKQMENYFLILYKRDNETETQREIANTKKDLKTLLQWLIFHDYENIKIMNLKEGTPAFDSPQIFNI